MFHPSDSFMRLKICGITRLEDALLASELGVDALGFVFYVKSPRYISPSAANTIIKQLPPFMTAVGLFVNPSQQDIDDTLSICELDAVQLHGDESPEFCKVQPKRVIKAIGVSTEKDLAKIQAFDCAVLLDTKAPQGVYGGTGTSFDWSVLDGIKHTHPLILAGGININNIGDARQVKGLYALDVSSGVESAKGIKDKQKMTEICRLMN